MDAIVAEELVKRYKDVQALDGLSFSVRDGEVFDCEFGDAAIPFSEEL